jgi:hypothetical protein
LDFGIDRDLVADLKKVGIQSGASFVVTLLAAFEVFLYHQTGQDDLVLGLPAAGQSNSGKTQLVGHCVNLLPLRSKLAADIPFNIYLKNRKEPKFSMHTNINSLVLGNYYKNLQFQEIHQGYHWFRLCLILIWAWQMQLHLMA